MFQIVYCIFEAKRDEFISTEVHYLMIYAAN